MLLNQISGWMIWKNVYSLSEKAEEIWAKANKFLTDRNDEKCNDYIEVAEKYQEALDASVLRAEAELLSATNEQEYYLLVEQSAERAAKALTESIQDFEKAEKNRESAKEEAASYWAKRGSIARKASEHYALSIKLHKAGEEELSKKWGEIADASQELRAYLGHAAMWYERLHQGQERRSLNHYLKSIEAAQEFQNKVENEAREMAESRTQERQNNKIETAKDQINKRKNKKLKKVKRKEREAVNSKRDAACTAFLGKRREDRLPVNRPCPSRPKSFTGGNLKAIRIGA